MEPQVNTFLCIGLGFCIDKWGGTLLSVILAGFHLSGSMVMSGAATNHLNSYPLLIVGKRQHRSAFYVLRHGALTPLRYSYQTFGESQVQHECT